MDASEVLWRQYSLMIDLYKFYMDLVVKFNVFYYAVTGGILSFFFANPDIDGIKYSLIDHEFDPEAVSKQCGAAAILKGLDDVQEGINS